VKRSQKRNSKTTTVIAAIEGVNTTEDMVEYTDDAIKGAIEDSLLINWISKP